MSKTSLEKGQDLSNINTFKTETIQDIKYPAYWSISSLNEFFIKSLKLTRELPLFAISAKLEIYDNDEKTKIFYRQLDDKAFNKINDIVNRLVDWQLWNSPKDSEIDKMTSNNKSVLKQWLKDKGLTTGYLMGASE